MNITITLLASTKGNLICASAPRVDTYRIENNDNARNVSLAFERIGAGLFTPTPYAFEVWSDDADNSGKGLYVEGGLSIAGNKLVDYDGGFFLPTSAALVLRHLGFEVSDDCLASTIGGEA
jgi:hypothetical protein